jgi:hypothetical protein
MSFQAKVVDRAATKPIYLIVARDETVKGKIVYYRTNDVTETHAYLDFRGLMLAGKAQVIDASTVNETNAIQTTKTEVNRKIPWVNIIRIENLSYKSKKEAQGE